MFDIYSKKNKHNNTIVETIAGEEGRFRDKEGFYRIKRDYLIILPGLNATINTHYNAENGFTWAGVDSEHFVDYTKNTILKIGKKEFVKKISTKEGALFTSKPVEDLDFNETVSALVAYDYVLKHAKDYVLKGITKEELKTLPLEELEKINKKIEDITKSFEDALKETLQHINEKKIDSQKMLDEAFGEGSVNLDKLVEEQVSQALILREEKTDKKIARDARIEKLHSGVMKMTKPVRLVANKIKTSISSSKENRNRKKKERRIKKEEDKRRVELIENIME